jgi:cytoskeletal protein CcmA (bactofilin family)
MFSKGTTRLETFLGTDSAFKGELNVKGTLRIDGSVEGRLGGEFVILSESARVKGEIRAKKVIIGGKVEGTVSAHELVEIRSKGKVLGDISTVKLAILEGGEFNGRVEMKTAEDGVLEPATEAGSGRD